LSLLPYAVKGAFLFKELVMDYKFKVIPTSIGMIAGSMAYAYFADDYSHVPPLTFGMVWMLILCGITKQAEWK